MENKRIYPLGDDIGFIELLASMGDDKTIADVARISYLGTGSGEESDRRIIARLLSSNPPHTSPLEQVELQFLVKCPIFVARQWMRHRTWSYNEVSRRYTSKDLSFYVPPMSDHSITIREHSELSAMVYTQLLENKCRKEIARMVLPVNFYTEFYAKSDLHNILHFLQLRLDMSAQYEIKKYALAISGILKQVVPICWDEWSFNENKGDF